MNRDINCPLNFIIIYNCICFFLTRCICIFTNHYKKDT